MTGSCCISSMVRLYYLAIDDGTDPTCEDSLACGTSSNADSRQMILPTATSGLLLNQQPQSYAPASRSYTSCSKGKMQRAPVVSVVATTVNQAINVVNGRGTSVHQEDPRSHQTQETMSPSLSTTAVLWASQRRMFGWNLLNN